MSWQNYPFYTVENAIPDHLIEDLVFKGKALDSDYGTTGDYIGEPVEGIRKSKVSFLNEHVFANIYELCDTVIKEVNQNIFAYDLGKLEPLQFSEYQSSYQGRYGWHVDTGFDTNVDRKLSFILQLSNESDYADGDLEFYNGEASPIKLTKSKGSMIVFPSIMWHRVTPVTSGTRYSLVGWINGPRFR